MRIQEYLKTWTGLQNEAYWSRIIQVCLVIIVFLLVFLVFSKNTTVVMQPFTLTEEAWVTKDRASQSYKEAWGLAIAQLIGNVTPGSVDFVKERLGPLLSPTIYQEVIEVVSMQAQQIKNDRISMRFEPRSVDYEEKTDKVFVTGYSFMKGISVSATEEREERTYEFIVKVSNYAPVFESINTYVGKPRTSTELERIERREESRRRRDEN